MQRALDSRAVILAKGPYPTCDVFDILGRGQTRRHHLRFPGVAGLRCTTEITNDFKQIFDLVVAL